MKSKVKLTKNTKVYELDLLTSYVKTGSFYIEMTMPMTTSWMKTSMITLLRQWIMAWITTWRITYTRPPPGDDDGTLTYIYELNFVIDVGIHDVIK